VTVPPPVHSRRRSDVTPPAVARVPGDVAGPVSPADGRAELREFFTAIGGFGARTRRRYDRIVPVRSRRSLVAICGILTLGGLIYQAWPHRPPSEMPLALRGAWVTTTKSYADRGFWIGTHQVAFRVGRRPDQVQVYTVTHLKARRISTDTTVYDIEYAVDGGTDRWSIEQIGSPRPAIVFVHQPQMTWTATSDPNPPVR
jgi:hypothetical protein